MTWLRHYLKLFADDVRHQKLRAFLTLFGIVWGSAAVTLLLAFGFGFRDRIETNMKGLGENIVIAWPQRTSKPWKGLADGRPIRLTEQDIEVVRARVPEIARISGEANITGKSVKLDRTTLSPQIHGVNGEFAEMRSMIPEAGGRFLNALDISQRRRSIFIGDKLKRDLFGDEEAVGRYVQVGGIPFLIVGVMEEKAQDSSYSGRDQDKALMPLATFQALYGRQYINNFVFQVADPRDVEAAKEGVLAVLAERHKFDPTDKEALMLWDTTENMKFLRTFFLGFNLFLGIVGALTLVVGGIGVSNIMNVVVEERTREIGIKMALGARKSYILGQFLFETLLITLLGGALGLGIAVGLGNLIALLPITEFIGEPTVSLRVAAITAAVLGLVGLLAGYFPARSAANLQPVEALRS